MGLDTTHNCWHGPYSAFGDWRNTIARAAGFGITTTSDGIKTVDLPYHDFVAKNYMGDWDRTPDEILMVLFVHSDCEGEIKPEHCGPLADRLEGLMHSLPVDTWRVMYRNETRQFIDGLRMAADAGEPVRFQ